MKCTISYDQAMSDRLLTLLRERSFRAGKVRLSSGKESDFFIDCKQAVLTSEGHALVGEKLFSQLTMLDFWPKAAAGVALGGCSLVSAVSLVAYQRGRAVDAIYVRKEVKDHGSKRWLEGNEGLPAGSQVVVIEDVITTGQSTLRAVERLRENNLQVSTVMVLVDREEGGRETLQASGLSVIALYRRRDFTDDTNTKP